MPAAIRVVPTQGILLPTVRLNGLDKLRGVAAILVVLLHAGIPYMTNPLPYLVWPARDSDPSAIVDGLTWCTECFLMPLFFVLAGFFSTGLLASGGERCFLAGRTKRLLWTQFAAVLIILPVCLCIWSIGWMGDGLYVPSRYVIFGFPQDLKAELFGMGHIWFLQNLYIYCLIHCCCSWLVKRVCNSKSTAVDGESRRARPTHLDRVFISVWKPLIPAIPCAVILFYDTRIVLGFYQTFFPVLTKLAYYSIYYLAGVIVYRDRQALNLHSRYGWMYVLIATLLFGAILPMIHAHLTVPLAGFPLAFLAGLLALFASFMTFGLFAVFLQMGHGTSATSRYLADASFWVYLIHLPFVALTQIAIAQTAIPTICKFLLVGTTALGLALMTYHVFVRETWLGKFLNGDRQLRNPLLSVRLEVIPSGAFSAPCGEAGLKIARSQLHAATARDPAVPEPIV